MRGKRWREGSGGKREGVKIMIRECERGGVKEDRG